MPKRIEEQVMVITGASSGIGLLTAIEASRRGAKVVLSARNRQDVQGALEEVRGVGESVIGIPADVTCPTQLEYLADRAVEEFGRIDAWINCAAAHTYGMIQEQSLEDFRRVLDVQFVGQALAAEVALPYLEESEGVFICLGSSLVSEGMPGPAACSAAQCALKGWIDGLRVELRNERSPVRVTLIRSSSVEAPRVQRRPTVAGLEPPEGPVIDLDLVSAAILEAVESNKRDVCIGGTGAGLSSWTDRINPALQQLRQRLPTLGKSSQEGRDAEDEEGEDSRARRMASRVALAGAGVAAAGAVGFYGWKKLTDHRNNPAASPSDADPATHYQARQQPMTPPRPDPAPPAPFPGGD